MRNLAICTLIALCIAALAGCGGSSGNDNGQNSFTVDIQNNRVTPKFNTIQQNDTMQFINASNVRQQVVSGTLDPQGNPLVIHLITISNTGFNPINTTGNLGDTVRFSNASFNTFVLDIVDDNGNVVSSLTIPVGNQQDFDFPAAGQYTIRSHANSLFSGTVTLFGRPNPNGLFQSPVLNNGGVFTRQFTQMGSFPYFILNQSNPNQSFITGNISVQ